VQIKLADALPHVFPSLRFHTIDLGPNPPVITNIRILPVAAPAVSPPPVSSFGASSSYASFSSASSLRSLSTSSLTSSLPFATTTAAAAAAAASTGTSVLASSLRFVCDVTYANDCTITLGVTSAPSAASTAADGAAGSAASAAGAGSTATSAFRRLAAKLSAAATFGVSRLTLSGTAEVSLSPLLPRLPLAGGVAVGFANPPALGMTFSGLAAAADLTAVVAAPVRRVVAEVLSAFAVLPNRVSFSLSGVAGERAPDAPPPLGVLRVRVVGVRDLEPGVDLGGVAIEARLGDGLASLPPGGAAADFLVVSPRQALRLAVTDAGRASAPLLGRGWVEAGPLLADAAVRGRPTKVDVALRPPWAPPIGVSPPTPPPLSAPLSPGGSGGGLTLAVTALGLSSSRLALPGAVATLLYVVVGAVGGLPRPIPAAAAVAAAVGGGTSIGAGSRRRRLRAALGGGSAATAAAAVPPPPAHAGDDGEAPPPIKRKVLVHVAAPGQAPRVTASASMRPEARPDAAGGGPLTLGAATEGVFFFLLPPGAASDPTGVVQVVVRDAAVKGDAAGERGAGVLTDFFVALEDVISRPGMMREDVFQGSAGGTVRLRLAVAAVGG